MYKYRWISRYSSVVKSYNTVHLHVLRVGAPFFCDSYEPGSSAPAGILISKLPSTGTTNLPISSRPSSSKRERRTYRCCDNPLWKPKDTLRSGDPESKMDSAKDTPSAKVILASPTDWEPWYTLLRDKATALQVWEFVDPDGDTPQPSRPEEPKVSDIKPGATELADLVVNNDRYLDLYKVALSKWQHADRNHDRVLAALQDVAEYIRTTVATSWVLLIDDKASLRAKVKALRCSLRQLITYQRCLPGKDTGRPRLWVDPR